MRPSVKNIYIRELFNPDWLDFFIHPLYLAHRGLWRSMSRFSTKPGGKLLEHVFTTNEFLRVIEHHKIGADASIIFQLANAYLFKITKNWPVFFRGVMMLTLMAFNTMLGMVVKFILPRNPDLFLDQIVLAEKVD